MWQGPWQSLTMYTPFHHLLKIHWVYCTYSMLSKSITRQFSLCLRGIMFKKYCSRGSGSLLYLVNSYFFLHFIPELFLSAWCIFWAFTCCFLTSSSGTVLNWKDIGSYWCIMAILKGSVGLDLLFSEMVSVSLYNCTLQTRRASVNVWVRYYEFKFSESWRWLSFNLTRSRCTVI